MLRQLCCSSCWRGRRGHAPHVTPLLGHGLQVMSHDGSAWCPVSGVAAVCLCAFIDCRNEPFLCMSGLLVATLMMNESA